MDHADISSILPYAQNNRTHPAQQIERIAESIKQFGFNQPIVVDETNTVLVGHGRLLAAQLLKLKTVPIKRVSNLTDTQKRAYRILDNKLQNDSDWDYAALEKEIEALELENFDMESWGLDKIKNLFGDVVTDPLAEYENGMPEFNQENKLPDQIIVSFENSEDRNAFAELLQQKFTPDTKSIWYPAKERQDKSGLRVVNGHSEDNA